jgi:hypothetical protein
MPDLNDARPDPPPATRARLEQEEAKSRALDTPQRTNDSTIDPQKPADEILEGFHGG